MKRIAFFISLLAVITTTNAQQDDYVRRHYMDIGVGIGTDYGGVLGVKFAVIPVPFVSLFASGGYYLVSAGWNTGVIFHILPVTKKYGFRPILKAMYGTNSAIKVIGAEHYDQAYIGPTFGVGIEMRFGQVKRCGLDIDINVPIRSQEFWDDLEEIQNDSNIEGLSDPMPIGISLGFHVEI